MARIVVDPVTRIEGHLRIEAEVNNSAVSCDAWSSGTMFRGIELILRGRDPREAWIWTQRICGVCTTVHALTSVRAVEDALGIEPPENASLIRNIIGDRTGTDHHDFGVDLVVARFPRRWLAFIAFRFLADSGKDLFVFDALRVAACYDLDPVALCARQLHPIRALFRLVRTAQITEARSPAPFQVYRKLLNAIS